MTNLRRKYLNRNQTCAIQNRKILIKTKPTWTSLLLNRYTDWNLTYF